MKKYILIFLISIISINFLNAQDLNKVLFDVEYGIDFVGLDFTEAKFIGGEGEYAPSFDLKNKWIPNWNTLFYTQSEKYDIGRFLRKRNVVNNAEYTIDLNSNIEIENMYSYKPYMKFSEEELQKIVNRYNFKYENEVGVSLIVTSFDKPSKSAVIYVVWFNTKTLKIIKSIKRITQPKGAGFRNFWAGSIFYTIKDLEDELLIIAKKELEKKEYKSWAKWEPN